MNENRGKNGKAKNLTKRTNYLSWHEYFASIARLIARRSKDPNYQVGALIVNQQKEIVATGYNGFPWGFSDDKYFWNDEGSWLETKYPYCVHAEANAVISAKQNCQGFILYTTLFPCNECAKLIIQAGIKTVHYLDWPISEQWGESWKATKIMFDEVGIDYQKLEV